MRRIVAFEAQGAKTLMGLFKWPGAIDGINDLRSIRIRKPLPGLDAKARGQELATILRRHPPVKQAIGMALAELPTAAPAPIYFRVASSSADELPWEELFVTPVGFVALDRRWPIGRIARRVHDVTPRVFEGSFRIVAVLSAAGAIGNGISQLETLVREVKAAPASVNAELHVITGDQAVIDAVAAGADPAITAEWIGRTPTVVERQIGDSRPAILHILCHGANVAGVAGLSLATQQDFEGDQKGSVFLSIESLAGALLSSTWLVVLAACKTAAGQGPAGAENGTPTSLPAAHSLADTGLPAVIGMREIVDLSAMNRFCRAIYPELLGIVTGAIDGDGSIERVIEWAPALTAPRRASAGDDPARELAWTHPVLYVQQEELRVDMVTPAVASELKDLRGQLDTWRSLLEGLDPKTTPPGFVEHAEQQITRLLREIVKATR
jgi:hypothetical protein